jgi:hypothetical protein
MSKLLDAMQNMIDDIRSEKGWVDELNQHSRKIATLYETMSDGDADEGLRRLALLLPNVPLVALGHVAITCGSLTERGGDPEIAGPALLEKLPPIAEASSRFYERCRQVAIADAELIAELRANPEIEDPETAPADVVDQSVSNHGWPVLTEKLGPELYRADPESVLAYMADNFYRLSLIAHLSRSRSLRKRARSDAANLESVLRADAAGNLHRSFLAGMLQVLDEELLLVLHVDQRKGYDVRISGISDNFQLHALLAGTLVGAASEGWIDGKRPDPRTTAQCRNAFVDGKGGSVPGAFNLFNWTAMKPDGSLPTGQREDSTRHWIWNEGNPSEILPFEGRRIVLLGPPPFDRTWNSGRQFPGMIAEMTVERKLGESNFDVWRSRLAAAATR